MTIRVLILGGYGAFGGRLARLLAGTPGLTLVVAGRNPAKAGALAAELGGGVEPARFDRDAPVEPQIEALDPDLVVDAMGPFQGYGEAPYRIVQAALSLGIDYMDLADAPDFVLGIAAFDAAARERGLVVLSGVSSVPVLTAAAVRQLAGGIARLDTVCGGIAPSPRAGLGLNVIRAAVAGAGRPVRLPQGTGWGLTGGRPYIIAPPGALPLDPRRFTLIDVPDLALLPREWPGLGAAWFGTGPVPDLLHRGLSCLAWLVRLRLVRSIAPLAPVFHRIASQLAWGAHRSGMFVEVTGRRTDGQSVSRSWHLLAEGDAGPMVPAMGIAALVGRMRAGARPESGARPAHRDLELADYRPLFARFPIVEGTRSEPGPGVSLYQRLLGDSFDNLPEPVRRMHLPGEGMRAAGRGRVERGRHPLAGLVAWLFGFPPAGADVPVSVTFRTGDGRETWLRDFDGRRFLSEQRAGEGRWRHLLTERFGPFVFGLALVVEGERLRLVPRRWTAFGLPMPRRLMPRGESHETATGGRFRFHVEIRLPLIGLVVRYRGWLVPETRASAANGTAA